MATEAGRSWQYLQHVTLREAWRELWGGFLAWVLLTALLMIFMATAKFGAEATEPWWSEIPKPVLYFLVFAAVTWFIRGESFTVAIPESVKGWLLLNVIVLVFAGASSVLPGWAFVPVYTGFIFGIVAMESLVVIGRSNYERLTLTQSGGG